MRSTLLYPPVVGVAACDSTWYAFGRNETGIDMRLSGRACPSLPSVLDQVTERLWYRAAIVGLSAHSPLPLFEVGPAVRQISPLAATYAGLADVSPKRMTALYRGRPANGPITFIKIGPKCLSWTAGDGVEHAIPASHILPPGDHWASYARYAATDGAGADGFQVLGNIGWVRFAQFVRGRVPIDDLTLTMLDDPDLYTARTIVSRLCWSAQHKGEDSHQIGSSVSRHMGVLLGRAVAYVAQLTAGGPIIVQYNAIAAVGGMPEWMVNNTRLVETMRRPQRLELPTVLLLDWTGHMTETVGAYRLVAAAMA